MTHKIFSWFFLSAIPVHQAKQNQNKTKQIAEQGSKEEIISFIVHHATIIGKTIQEFFIHYYPLTRIYTVLLSIKM